MQRLLLTAVFFLITACANEKFQDQGLRGNIDNQSPQAIDAQPEATTEIPDASMTLPAEVEESTAANEPSQQVQKPLFADCETTPDRPIVADLYQLATDTKALPDYSQMKAIKKICLSQLDIKTRAFSDGFPGVEKLFEWFSLDMRFSVKVPKEGKWDFKLVADDGAILYVDQRKVIDNDGVHQTQEKTGRTQLSAGVHQFRVSYFQGPRFNIALELYWKASHDKEYSYIPQANIMRPVDLKLSATSPD